MTFRTESTLAGYARAAVDARIRMAEYTRTPAAREWARICLTMSIGDHIAATGSATAEDEGVGSVNEILDVLDRSTTAVWEHGDTYVLAPAMTAIIAAAAQALDLTGDLLDAAAAPCEHGILFLPEPIYHRHPRQTLSRLAAITWTTVTTTGSRQRSWLICGWWDTSDPGVAVDVAALRSHLQVGPYMFSELTLLPIAEPIEAHETEPVDEADTAWQNAPDGSYVITETRSRTDVCAAIAYAFWRIQAQPLATTARPPLDRSARRRADRAKLNHDTRVVMLRRISPVATSSDREPKWHYKVRFMVRGHWRHLVRADGQPYKIWINLHIKGPDGAPMLLGEKVNILAR